MLLYKYHVFLDYLMISVYYAFLFPFFTFVKLMIFLGSLFSFHKMEIQPYNCVLLEAIFTFLDNI